MLDKCERSELMQLEKKRYDILVFTGRDLISSEVISIFRQQVGHFLHVDSVIEGRGVSNFTFICRHLKGN